MLSMLKDIWEYYEQWVTKSKKKKKSLPLFKVCLGINIAPLSETNFRGLMASNV